jgi:hypothetical protein
VNAFSKIESKNNELSLEELDNLKYEKFGNLFEYPKQFNQTAAEYIDIIEFNLSQLDSFEVGDIIKFEGFKLFGAFVLYHHQAILAGQLSIFYSLFLVSQFYSISLYLSLLN